jgi:glycosyltransferase involved in cell wall biosynthesis
MRLSSALDRALAGSAPSSDIIHNHGLWLMPNVKAGWSAHSAKVPFVLSPHGMLSATALSFSRMKKQAFWKLMQRSVVARAACLHATSEAEHQDIRDMGLVNPVAIIPIGVDVPPPALRPESAQRTVMSLGRVHPKKGLDRLISAWAEVEASNPSWRLRIIGPSEQGHDDELRALATTLGLTRMSIEGPLYGPETLNAYRSADLFVLPTRNENFGMTVAEALAAGTPAISTTGAPWAGLETEGCGWWIDQGVEPLAATLREAMAMPREALLAKGEKGRRWVTREFSWARTASDLFDVYRWLASAASPPPSVRFV